MGGIEIFQGFWRDSARELKLFFFNAWVAVPFLIFILHITWLTFGTLVITVIGMMVIERFGFTVPVAALYVRSRLAGSVIKRRRMFFNRKIDR